MSTDMMLIIGAGVLAILYGVYAIRSIMAADAGNERYRNRICHSAGCCCT